MERTGPPKWPKRNCHVIVSEPFPTQSRMPATKKDYDASFFPLRTTIKQFSFCLHHNWHVSDSTGGGYHGFVPGALPTWTEDGEWAAGSQTSWGRMVQVWSVGCWWTDTLVHQVANYHSLNWICLVCFLFKFTDSLAWVEWGDICFSLLRKSLSRGSNISQFLHLICSHCLWFIKVFILKISDM